MAVMTVSVRVVQMVCWSTALWADKKEILMVVSLDYRAVVLMVIAMEYESVDLWVDL